MSDRDRGQIAPNHLALTAWVLEGQLATLFDPPEKRGRPGPFRAYAVELPK